MKSSIDVVFFLFQSGEHVTVRRDEIRLLESRKSNRLLVRQTSASDLNKSSDFSIFQVQFFNQDESLGNTKSKMLEDQKRTNIQPTTLATKFFKVCLTNFLEEGLMID